MEPPHSPTAAAAALASDDGHEDDAHAPQSAPYKPRPLPAAAQQPAGAGSSRAPAAAGLSGTHNDKIGLNIHTHPNLRNPALAPTATVQQVGKAAAASTATAAADLLTRQLLQPSSTGVVSTGPPPQQPNTAARRQHAAGLMSDGLMPPGGTAAARGPRGRSHMLGSLLPHQAAQQQQQQQQQDAGTGVGCLRMPPGLAVHSPPPKQAAEDPASEGQPAFLNQNIHMQPLELLQLGLVGSAPPAAALGVHSLATAGPQQGQAKQGWPASTTTQGINMYAGQSDLEASAPGSRSVHPEAHMLSSLSGRYWYP